MTDALRSRRVTDELKPPIFLLGNVRSGTSLMHDLFDLHPEVKSWYEPRTIWIYADPGRLHDRFDEADATERVIRYIRRRFLRYQRRHGGLRIMEKTPSNVLRIPYVHAIFPESRFVYMVREPLAYLNSSELKWRRSISFIQTWRRLKETPKTQLHHYVWRYVVDKCRAVLAKEYVSVWGVRYPEIYEDLKRFSTELVIARQWVACSNQAEAELAKLDPNLILRLRYEDFVADPVNQFDRVLAHFGLSMTTELAKTVDSVVDKGRQGKWRRLDRKTLGLCLPILAQEMARHGYEVPPDLRERAF